MADYVTSEAVTALPENHQQQQIQTALVTHYGTAASPQFFLPADAPEENAEDDAVALVEYKDEDRLAHGAAVYRLRCAPCHGASGDGNGEAAAFLNPKPRDYRKGIFKFTSTPYGYKPRRQDLVRTIRRGAKGTSMPAFPWLSDDDVQAVVDYVLMLSYRGETEGVLAYEAEEYDPDEELEAELFTDVVSEVHGKWQEAETSIVLPMTPQPLYSEETVRLGQQAFLKYECSKCHGVDGRGQTEWLSPAFLAAQEAMPPEQRIQINRDAWDQVAPAADLTAGMLHGGRRPVDIYRRIYSGINGTPMPGFAERFRDQPETIWHLTHFVISLTKGHKIESPSAPADSVAAD